VMARLEELAADAAGPVEESSSSSSSGVLSEERKTA
ncbi:hypothetical protein PR001_g33686, partial [Phytophthora rubi]